MPQNFPNMFSPQTQVGQGLQNIAHMLLASNANNGKAQLNSAQEQAYYANAAKAQAEAEKAATEAALKRQQMQGQGDFLGNTLRTMLPADDVGAADNFLKGTPVMAFIDGRQPQPRSVTADNLPALRRAQVIDPAVRAGGGNAEQIMQAIQRAQEVSNMDAAASGQLKTPAIQAIRGLKGNDNFKVDGGSVLDVLTGALLGTTPLTQSQMMTEGTKQQENRAQAGAAGRSNQLQDVPNPLDGGATMVRVPTSVVYQEGGRTARNDSTIAGRETVAGMKGGAGGKILKASKSDLAALDTAINDNLGSNDDFPVDPADPAVVKIRELAQQLFSTPGSAGYANHAAAARLATEGVTAKQEGNWNPLKSNKTVLTMPPTPIGAAPQSRPAGKTDAQLIAEANAAIKAGKDPAAVKARLSAFGVKVQ